MVGVFITSKQVMRMDYYQMNAKVTKDLTDWMKAAQLQGRQLVFGKLTFELMMK
jgi:hypothetical protein